MNRQKPGLVKIPLGFEKNGKNTWRILYPNYEIHATNLINRTEVSYIKIITCIGKRKGWIFMFDQPFFDIILLGSGRTVCIHACYH